MRVPVARRQSLAANPRPRRESSRETRAQHGPLSVAILPFKDLSGTADSQIFTDGIAEMIRSRLGESRTVRVITTFDRAAAKENGRSPEPRFLETGVASLREIGVPAEQIKRESYG